MFNDINNISSIAINVEILVFLFFGGMTVFSCIILCYDNSISVLHRSCYVFLFLAEITFFLTQEPNTALICIIWIYFIHNSNSYFLEDYKRIFLFLLTILLVFVTEVQLYYLLLFLYYGHSVIRNDKGFDRKNYASVAFLTVSSVFFLLLSLSFFWNQLYFLRFFFFFLTFLPKRKKLILLYLDAFHWVFISKDLISLAGFNWISVVIYGSFFFELIHYLLCHFFQWSYFYWFSPIWVIPALWFLCNLWINLLKINSIEHFNGFMVETSLIQYYQLNKLLAFKPKVIQSIIFKRFAWKLMGKQMLSFGKFSFDRLLAEESFTNIKGKFSQLKIGSKIAFIGSGLFVLDSVGKRYLSTLNFANELNNFKRQKDYLAAYAEYEMQLKLYHTKLQLYNEQKSQWIFTRLIHNFWTKKEPLIYPVVPTKPKNFIPVPDIPEDQWFLVVYYGIVMDDKSIFSIKSVEDLI